MKQTGVLVIAHGSRRPDWVARIDQAVELARLSLPVQTVFLEFVPDRTIADGIYRLEAAGVERIIVIPLFVTMGSTHLHEIQYTLGLIPEPAISTGMREIDPQAEIIWCPPIEDHPYVTQILTERIRPLSRQPVAESLLLIGHGSEVKGFHEVWEALLHRLTETMQLHFGFNDAAYATLHPDNIRERARACSKQNRLIVVPLFLSEGYFTKHYIPNKLQGLSYSYDGRTYLPHPLISAWIRESVLAAMSLNKKTIDGELELLYTLNR